jgi:hypothetical protein
VTPALAPCNDPACVYCLCHQHGAVDMSGPPSDDYILGLYAPDRPRSAAAGIIVAAAVVVIVGAFLVLAFAVWG